MNARKPYPRDASDKERSFVVPYLALVREDSEQRRHALREALNALRWMRAGCFGAIVHDRRELLRVFDRRKAQPGAMIIDSRTLQSTPESGARTGYDRAKRLKGSKVHLAVDTPGQLLALHVTPANERDLIKRFRIATEPTTRQVPLYFAAQK
ncbi:transposase [Burkholderia sp. D-99]|uniref:transposase n=1 Tax=Burkholderia sp. D-99 TaxID=2717316 RepID=UPI0014231289|nr:transposase [Burkholderia sp. D-99]